MWVALVALAVNPLVQSERAAIRCVCPALWLALAARFPGLVWLLAQLRLLLLLLRLLLLLIAGLALLLLLGSLLKLLLLLTDLILLRALLGLLRLLGLLFLGLLALGLLLGCLLLRGLSSLVLLALHLLLLLLQLLLLARLPLLILLGALLGLMRLLCLLRLLLFLQLPLRLLLPHRLFLQGALADGVFGLPALLLLLPRHVRLLALLVALKPSLLGTRTLLGVKHGPVWRCTWLRQGRWNNLRGLAGPGLLAQAFSGPVDAGVAPGVD